MGTESLNTEEVKKDISELEQKIIRQIEYYFGDFNLRRDRYLKEQVKEDEGWVSLETMMRFNRLKSITEDSNTICEALKKNPDGLMEVNDDGTKIRRKLDKPLSNEARDEVEDRTLYVKGFRKNTSLDELLEFFKIHKAENIQMRRRFQQKNKPFKGSCFVSFKTKEDAEKFLNLQGIKFENTELLKETKKFYMKRKDEFYQNLKEEKAKKQQEKAEGKPTDDKEKTDEKTEDDNEKSGKHIGDKVPGCLLRLIGFGSEMIRETIREALEKFGEISYVDYNKGNPEAVVRFTSPVAAKVLEEAEDVDNGKVYTIGSCKLTISVLEGDVEDEYWKNIAKGRQIFKQNNHGYKGKGFKGRFNNSWSKRPRGGNRDDGDQPPSKKQKKASKAENGSEAKMEEAIKDS